MNLEERRKEWFLEVEARNLVFSEFEGLEETEEILKIKGERLTSVQIKMTMEYLRKTLDIS